MAVATVLSGGLVGLLAYASWTDVTRMIIRNWTVLAVLALALVKGLALEAPFGWRGTDAGMALAAVRDVGAALVVFMALFVMWLMRGMGAGDVKLAGACALWAGTGFVLDFVLAFAVVGGVASMLLMGMRFVPAVRERVFRWLPWFRAGGQLSFPYGPAIAVGALWALWLQAGAGMFG
jgi:prepilin peptidase CpaA